jgi:hypothetical protein
MKRLNRAGQGESKGGRSRMLEEKATMERKNLQLQNLQYEKIILTRQLHSLQAQKPAIAWQDLIGLDPSLPRPSHPEILLRLANELEQRRLLEEKQKAHVALHTSLANQLQTLRGSLNEALKELPLVLERAERVRDAIFPPPLDFGAPSSSSSSSSSPSSSLSSFCSLLPLLSPSSSPLPASLPAPLYALYLKSSAYAAAFPSASPQLSVSVGHVEDLPAPGFYEKDPLFVELCLSSLLPSSPASTLRLRFTFLRRVGFVVVRGTFSPPHPLLEGPFLHHLCTPDDAGDQPPNPATSLLPDLVYDATQTKGYGYQWAQQLCGLLFQPLPPVHLGDIVYALTLRCRSLLSLADQLGLLQRLELPSLSSSPSSSSSSSSPPFVSSLPLPRARLVLFKEQKEAGKEGGKEYLKRFRCAVERSKVRVEAIITLGHDYPRGPPSFRLSFLNLSSSALPSASPDVDLTALTLPPSPDSFFDNNVRAIESELNDHWAELVEEDGHAHDPSLLLTLQLRKLLLCLDIYVDSDKKDSLAALALSDRKVRGRDRLKPFKISSEGLAHRNVFFD